MLHLVIEVNWQAGISLRLSVLALKCQVCRSLGRQGDKGILGISLIPSHSQQLRGKGLGKEGKKLLGAGVS